MKLFLLNWSASLSNRWILYSYWLSSLIIVSRLLDGASETGRVIARCGNNSEDIHVGRLSAFNEEGKRNHSIACIDSKTIRFGFRALLSDCHPSNDSPNARIHLATIVEHGILSTRFLFAGILDWHPRSAETRSIDRPSRFGIAMAERHSNGQLQVTRLEVGVLSW